MSIADSGGSSRAIPDKDRRGINIDTGRSFSGHARLLPPESAMLIFGKAVANRLTER